MRQQGYRPIVAFALLAVAGCGTPESLKFNNAILNANKRLEASSVSLRNAVNANINSSKVDDAKLASAYDEVAKALESVKQEMKELKIPEKPSAKAFYDAHQKFLEGQEHIVKVDFKEVLDAMKSLPPEQRRNKIDLISLRVQEREKGDLPALQAAQCAFAADYNIKLQ